ncbi:g6429 [Coccomyxa viridis]|uniref:G6429 protein n=1 Tax=Coccomyxa viridis TaxID=1274662 RepID=A0ABP1FVD1_9CHLO
MGQKRNRPADGDQENAPHQNEDQPEQEKLTPYELQRQRLIEQNRRRLIELGIPAAVAGLNNAVTQHKPPAKKREKRKPKERKQPTRASSRLKGEGAAEDEASELALFVINGDCPRCGKVLSQGFKQHLGWCKGRRQEAQDSRDAEGEEGADDELDEEEEDEQELAAIEASKEAERTQRMDKKLSSLHLDGLVDFSEAEAKFIVLGSTKKHYTVTLSDARHTCQCVDFRIRKHNCKHIRLVLTQLDIAHSPGDWKQAVEKKLDEAQNEVLDQPLAHRAKAARGKKAASPVEKAAPKMQDTDAAQAAKFL